MMDDDEFERNLSEELFLESVSEKLLALMSAEGVGWATLTDRARFPASYLRGMFAGDWDFTFREAAKIAHALGYRLFVEAEKIP